MDMSGMSGMSGGMDSSSDPMFRTYNQVLARGYWYIFAIVVTILLIVRAADKYQIWVRLRRSRARSLLYPTKVDNIFEKVYATSTAILREMSYPQYIINNRYLAWLSPPPLGRVLFLCCYWSVLVFMMTHNAIIKDAYYYERIGFRNAWIALTQVPLVYLLASKSSIIGFLVGSSHERLNWLHRWVSRTLLITVTVHGGFFMREWIRADFVKLELEMMPMVKYGLGAWGILVWTFITSLSPLRSMAYELFVLQHIAAAAVLLWLLWVHVPSYAAYNVWFAIGAISFDWILRFFIALYRNLNIRSRSRHCCCSSEKIVGHQIDVQPNGNDITIVIIKDAHISWKPGQHLYLWIPALGPLETHPFTIAIPCKTSRECHCNEIQLAIKVQSGFSRRIHKYALTTQGRLNRSLTGFISGPYGVPPQWGAYETLILISASTGASFTLPILESVLDCQSTLCTKRITFLLVVRRKQHTEYYESRLEDALHHAEEVGITLDVVIAITGDETLLGDDDGGNSIGGEYAGENIHDEKTHTTNSNKFKVCRLAQSKSHSISTSSGNDKMAQCESFGEGKPEAITSSSSNETSLLHGLSCRDRAWELKSSKSAIKYIFGRPNVENFIREPVEATGGETSVAVCGGKSLVARVRNFVASLSDERAVHKGTGAQGIHLHVEEYCF